MENIDQDKIPKLLPRKKYNLTEILYNILMCILGLILILILGIGFVKTTYIMVNNIKEQNTVCSKYGGVHSYGLFSLSLYFECKDGSSFNLHRKRE